MNLFNLSPEDLSRFLLLFDSDREVAGEKYQRLRRKLSMFFSKKECLVINRLVDKVFDQIFNMIIKGEKIEKIDHLALFKASRHVLPEYRRDFNKNQQKFVSSDDNLALDIDNYINKNNQDERLKNDEEIIINEIFPNLKNEGDKRLPHIRFCMEKHAKTADAKQMILTYHYNENQKQYQVRKKLAEYLGISSGNLRIRVNRLQEKLFDCINDCLEKEGC